MRRWNGWGDDAITYPVPPSAIEFLTQVIGPTTPPRDVPLEQVVGAVPEGRLPEHPLVTTDPEERVRHARGQSLPDWIAMRSGGSLPFLTAWPTPRTRTRCTISSATRPGPAPA